MGAKYWRMGFGEMYRSWSKRAFVEALRAGGIPASLKEHLLLLEALDADVAGLDPEQFYYLSRAIFVHDESQLDRFDRIFGEVFKGVIA